MCLKSYFKEIVLKLAKNGQSDRGFLLTSTYVPKGLSAPALGLYTCIKALKYIPGPGFRWAFTGPLVLWFLNIFRTDRWILIKFCVCIDRYKIHVVSNACYFWSIFNRVMALDWQNFVYALYLVNWFLDFDQILYMHWYRQDIDLDDWTICSVHFHYGPWL